MATAEAKQMRLGAKVRGLRRQKGLSQVQLAERLEISPSYLNLIEGNRRPLPAGLLIKLAQIFQVDLHAFATDEYSSAATIRTSAARHADRATAIKPIKPEIGAPGASPRLRAREPERLLSAAPRGQPR